MTQVRPGYLGPAQLSTLANIDHPHPLAWPPWGYQGRGSETTTSSSGESSITPILTHSMNGHLNMLNRPRAATLGEMSSFLQSNMSAVQRYNVKTM